MRYFSLENYHAGRWDDDDEEADRQLERDNAECAAYERRVEELRALLPPRLIEIAQAWYVDDALLARAAYDQVNLRLTLSLRCGNIPDGYFDLDLEYEGVDISEEHLRVLCEIARGTSCTRFDNDAYCHELDLLDDGRIEHRFLFYPGVWFAIRCQRLTWERTERANRTLPRLKSRFRTIRMPKGMDGKSRHHIPR